MSTRRLQAWMAAAALWSGCLFDPPGHVSGGGSSETTNGVVIGSVRNSDGTAAANARVALRPRDYLKDTSAALPKSSRRVKDVLTDAAGRFFIDSVPPGDYNIEAAGAAREAVLIQFSTGDRDTLKLEAQSLKPTGAIAGQVTSELANTGHVFVQVYGMDRVAKADSITGKFSFASMPEGSYTVRALAASRLIDPRVITGVPARGLDTTQLGAVVLSSFEGEDYSAWGQRAKLILNTTSSGADVKTTVTGFPLLVRLDRGNFDFSQSDGKDIRFSSRSGRHLHYEIERWDAGAMEAEIWVKMDSILGNSNKSFLTMHWGRANAPDWSDGRAVFDSADGFGGVWHLGEEAADTTRDGLYRDATPGAGHGNDRITSTDAQGIIGRGHHFVLGDYIQARPGATLRPPGEIMISAWYKGTSTGTLGSEIATLGDSYGLRVERDGRLHVFVYGGNNVWPELNSSGVNLLDSSWHHVVGIYNGSALQVYVDGEIRGSVPTTGAIPYTLGPNFYIGRHGTQKRIYDFKGHLDEVAVHRRVRSPSWIKLCFASQRMNATLVEFP
jgi:hypothetical protein